MFFTDTITENREVTVLTNEACHVFSVFMVQDTIWVYSIFCTPYQMSFPIMVYGREFLWQWRLRNVAFWLV